VNKKVICYLTPGASVEEREVKEFKLLIYPTKHERALYPLSKPGSCPVRLCELAAVDPIARVFFFLKRNILRVPWIYRPLIASFPVLLPYDERFVNLIFKKDKSVYAPVEAAQRDVDSLVDVIFELEAETFGLFLLELMKDPIFRSTLATRRPLKKPKDILKRIDSLITNPVTRKAFNEIMRKHHDRLGKIFEVLLRQLPLISGIEVLKRAKENGDALLEIANNSVQKINETLLRVGNIIPLSYNAICLECVLRKQLPMPFQATLLYTKDFSLIERCHQCSGETILHRINVHAPSDLIALIQDEQLPEAIVGYTLAQLEDVEEVFVHKKINPVINGSVRQSAQIDVLAITKDERLIIVEVTRQSDLETILNEELIRKIRLLEQIGFKYDIFICISGLSPKINHGLSVIKAKRAFLLGLKHLSELENWLADRLKKMA